MSMALDILGGLGDILLQPGLKCHSSDVLNILDMQCSGWQVPLPGSGALL